MAPPCQRRSALVASVAEALSFAIDDPLGHNSWTLNELHTSPCKRRRGATETQRSATVFDSSAIPPIGIHKYLARLSATFQCSDATFIAALVVVDRLLEYDGGRLPLTLKNVHRIFLASLVVAVKYHEDLVYSNSHYAKSGGVHLREVNRLERVLLTALDFDLRMSPEQYQTYEAALVSLCDTSTKKGSVNATEGVLHKPLASEGAAAPSACAIDTPSALTAAPVLVPQVHPVSLLANPDSVPTSAAGEESSSEETSSVEDATTETTPPAARLRPAASPEPAAALHHKAMVLAAVGVCSDRSGTLCPVSGCEPELATPWVVPPDRSNLLSLELAQHMLVVQASR